MYTVIEMDGGKMGMGGAVLLASAPFAVSTKAEHSLMQAMNRSNQWTWNCGAGLQKIDILAAASKDKDFGHLGIWMCKVLFVKEKGKK